MRKLKTSSQFIVGLAALSLIATYFLPIWRIDLWAPQYPEGLVMKIWLSKLAGDVGIINGLNHYIGMAHISQEMFPEFFVLPYLVAFLTAFGLLTAALKSRKLLMGYFSLLVLFGLAALCDFWRWGYQYGHNLDPKAPIQVPGMSYQPPLIGYKQLLNFGAYSIPDAGGWVIASVGVIIGLVMAYEFFFSNYAQRLSTVPKNTVMVAMLGLMLSFQACSAQPEPVKYGLDACSSCKMTLTDKQFVAELGTRKGKVFKFDDLGCLKDYMWQNNLKEETVAFLIVSDFNHPGELIDVGKAVFVKSEALHSPMRGNVAAFADTAAAEKFRQQFSDSQLVLWRNF